MNQQPAQSKFKTYGTIVAVILVFLLVYFYMSGSSPSSGTLIAGNPFGSVGSSELSLLNQVRSLKIDTSLFTDPGFRSLVDYSVAITPENVGRPNPFAPLPGISSSQTTTQAATPSATQPAAPVKTK